MEMDQIGIGPSQRTFLILVRRLIAAGFNKQAIRAFDDMESFVGRASNGWEFNFLLDTLCKYGYVKVRIFTFSLPGFFLLLNLAYFLT